MENLNRNGYNKEINITSRTGAYIFPADDVHSSSCRSADIKPLCTVWKLDENKQT